MEINNAVMFQDTVSKHVVGSRVFKSEFMHNCSGSRGFLSKLHIKSKSILISGAFYFQPPAGCCVCFSPVKSGRNAVEEGEAAEEGLRTCVKGGVTVTLRAITVTAARGHVLLVRDFKEMKTRNAER